jgi:agmatinase
MELWDEEVEANIFEIGIHTFSPLVTCPSPQDMIERVYLSARIPVKEGKFVVLLGGEHSLTQGIVRAYYEKYPLLSVLQIDAHTDLREEYDSSPLSHACAMRWIYDQEIPLVQVGIRSTSEEERGAYEKNRSNIFLASEIVNEHSARWVDEVILRLSDMVYITLDVDGLDPSIMPSTGTPEPGGLGWYQLLALLRKVASWKKIVGFDIVELAPQKQNPAPDYLCARLLYKLLGYIFLSKASPGQVSRD